MEIKGIENTDIFRTPAPPAEVLFQPIRHFAKKEASGGIVLLVCAIIALVWANSPWAESYFHLWHTEITLGFGHYHITQSLHFWINDGLMSIFFFVVGLEIKREILIGELSSSKKAMLPIFAAAGGMLAPALIYLIFNPGRPTAHGWGIPMATDIAFALGVLALLGKRVPISLKVFLTALAIADDIGAVTVIAIFYSSNISWSYLFMGMGALLVMSIGNWLGIRWVLFYAIIGSAGLWVAFFLSGVHPTVAGVLAAFAIPARTRINTEEFLFHGKVFLDDFSSAHRSGIHILPNESQMSAIYNLNEACDLAHAPLQKLEHALHPWVAFFIMPLFALANAGVTFGGQFFQAIGHPVSLGIILGLFFGKQLGIFGLSWICVKLRLADLPEKIKWRQIYATAILGGIGFTMSLFITGLAFKNPEYTRIAKKGILVASLLAGIIGYIVLKATSKKSDKVKP